jgi:hypothetical protein
MRQESHICTTDYKGMCVHDYDIGTGDDDDHFVVITTSCIIYYQNDSII